MTIIFIVVIKSIYDANYHICICVYKNTTNNSEKLKLIYVDEQPLEQYLFSSSIQFQNRKKETEYGSLYIEYVLFKKKMKLDEDPSSGRAEEIQ